MFDVLVYLYENYWRPDACPDHQQLSRKLSAVGFDPTRSRTRCAGSTAWPQRRGLRAPAARCPAACASTPSRARGAGRESIGFISFLESAGVLPPPMREMVIDRAMAVGSGPMDLEDLKVIVLMVFWSLGEEPDALILDELFVAPEDRLIH
jgi:Smg protein